VDTTTPAVGATPAMSESQSSTRFGYAAGFGYNFNRSVGAELRYVSTHYANQTAWDPAANSLQAGLTLRF
jgi:hypothetical protein